MKYIVVPISVIAMRRLDYDRADSAELKKVTLSDDEFLHLEQAGVFEEINSKLNAWIADYEDAQIVGAVALKKLCEILAARISNAKGDTGALEKLQGLATLAHAKRTGVFFYF